MIEKLLIAIGAGLAAAKLTESQQQALAAPVVDVVGEWLPDVFNTQPAGGNWTPPQSAEPYIYLLNRAEQKYGIPNNLLTRVAYQESRFRDDIINGQTKSAAGAVGIMQIVPRWHPGVDPLDVPAAIDYAGQYLAQLKGIAGSWEMALAAYNWGIGNLRREGFENAPTETRNYVKQIAGDVLGTYYT